MDLEQSPGLRFVESQAPELWSFGNGLLEHLVFLWRNGGATLEQTCYIQIEIYQKTHGPHGFMGWSCWIPVDPKFQMYPGETPISVDVFWDRMWSSRTCNNVAAMSQSGPKFQLIHAWCSIVQPICTEKATTILKKEMGIGFIMTHLINQENRTPSMIFPKCFSVPVHFFAKRVTSGYLVLVSKAWPRWLL